MTDRHLGLYSDVARSKQCNISAATGKQDKIYTQDSDEFGKIKYLYVYFCWVVYHFLLMFLFKDPPQLMNNFAIWQKLCLMANHLTGRLFLINF